MTEIEIGGFESGNTGSEGQSEVSQESIIRVNEELGEARKVRQGIGASIASNSKLADFIKFLVLTQADDRFWDKLGCFWINNGLGEAEFLVRVFVGALLPIYSEKADELGLQNELKTDYHLDLNFQSYLLYIKQIFVNETDSWKIDESKFREFLKMIITIYNIQMLEQDSLEQFSAKLKN